MNVSKAEIKKIGNQTCLFVNDEIFPPMSFTVRSMTNSEYLKKLRESGIRIFFVFANSDWMRPGKKDDKGNIIEKSGFEAFDDEVNALLKAVPDAYIVVRIGMHPPTDWVDAHPDDVVTYNDNTFNETTLVSEIHKDTFCGHYFLGSENWRQDGKKALNSFIDRLEQKDYFDRIIGFFFAAGGTSEWYYTERLLDYKNNRYGDFSKAFKNEFTEFLKNKYKTEAMLKKVWCDSDATFENPKIPDISQSAHIDIDDILIENIHNLMTVVKKDDDKADKETANIGVLLNANEFQHTADFYLAWNAASAKSVVFFSKCVKERYPGMITGSFYGSMACSDYYDCGTCSATLDILDSGYVDFLAAPGTYNNRMPGEYITQREAHDSFTIRNMLYLCEDDSRTHLDGGSAVDCCELYSVRDSVETLKRDFARNICENTYAWWFDQFPKGGRYDCDEILDLFKKQQEISRIALLYGKGKRNEIAVIYNPESIHYLSRGANKNMLEFFRTTELGRIGAGIDFYFDRDMDNEKMPDYKMYIMVNPFCIDNEARTRIQKKLAKNKATVVWLYAAGLVNPDLEMPLDTANMKELTGMDIKLEKGIYYPKFALEDDALEKLEYCDCDRIYGFIDRPMKNSITFESELKVPFVSPLFYIDEGDSKVNVLGRYLKCKRPAFAEIKHPLGYTSIYCGTQILRSDILKSVAKNAGCHIYDDADNCVYASRDFVTLHAKKSGEYRLKFNEICSPYDVYENKFMGNDVTEITVKVKKGDTLMLCVNAELADKLKY